MRPSPRNLLTGKVILKKGDLNKMAKTKTGNKGKGKKIVPVKPYVRKGTKVSGHRRSTPN